MNESLLNRILKDHKRRTRSLALILCLSMIVSLGTFAGFHKNAIAKVYTREVLDCPYAREGAEPVAHVHNDDCYEGETLVCTLPEREAHTHTDECFAEQRVLVCTLEENPGHQHSEECFDENGELICQIPEGEGTHAHTDACYTIERVLVCDKPELPVHVHDAGCFHTEEINVDEAEETVAPEQTVNTVPEMPVGDPNADLETAEDWNREFENFELSGNWARDLVLVAATQQGRGESQYNFEAVLNDAGDAWVRHGYTRYGAWYGYPYAEWDAMFVSFCLRYAGIPAENVPNNPTAAFMAESFSKGGLFAGRDYIPAVGDLIFFDTVNDEITNIDHMGIVYHVDAANGTINTVEGDRTDAVATFGYYLNDEQIVGYGILPQNPNYIPVEEENADVPDEAFDGFIFMTTDEEEEKQEETTTAEEATAPAVPMPAQSWERTAGGIKVTVDAPEGAFPENTRIAVTPVNGNSLKDTVSDAVSGEVLEVQAVDITFFDASGREIEPAVPIRVVMTPAATENAEEKTSVVHVDIAQQTAELVEQAVGTEFDNSEVVFDADAFTIYAIVYTYQVEYEYEVDGKTFTSSMPGAENMSLTQIVQGLGIVDETEIDTFVSKIASIASSNEEVAIVNENNEIRVLKDGEAKIVITMQDGAKFHIDVRAEGETSAEADNTVISTVGELYLPENAVAKAEVLNEGASESAIAAVEAAEANTESDTNTETAYQVFDISLENVDAEHYAEGFEVALTLPESVRGRDFRLYHVHDNQVEELELNTDSQTLEDGTELVSSVSFVTPGFSEFVLKYTVDFEYSVNGKMYQFSLPGGEYMTLHQLVEELSIIENTSFESADEFVRHIDNVEFSDPELIRVAKITEDTVIELSDATGDGEDELWAVKESTRGNLASAFDMDPITGTLEVSAGDWLLTSLAPFTSEEALTITMKNGDVVTIKVTDAQYGEGNIEIPDSGIVSLTDLTTSFTATCQSNTTDVNWDAHIDFLFKYVFSDDGVSAVTEYARINNASPTIVYDFSSVFDQTALNSVTGESYYLTTGLKTVGKITISEDGKVTMTFTDLDWLESRNSIRGTFNLDLIVDEDEAKDKGSDTVNFPGTSTGTNITYKTTVSNASKSLGWPNSVENADGSVTIFYNATVDANTALSSLVFTDTITAGSAIIDAGSVKVNGNSVSGLSNGQNMSFDLANVSGLEKTDGGKLKAGRYTVSYTATIPASEVASMAQGEKETIVNTSKWKADGKDEIEVPPVTYEWTKPVTPIPVTKSADKTNVDMTSGTGQTVNYTLTFGDENTPLADFRIADYITDVFTDYSAINVSWNGGSTTLTASGQATDNAYSADSVTLFDYTFPSGNTAYGPVTVTYSAKTIDVTTAKKNNIFDTVNATNTAQELRTNNSQTSTTVITYPERPDISVSKTASIPDEYKNADGTLKDGATITYTITIGDANTDISNLNITDSMSHLQSVDLRTATIQIGNGTQQSLTSYISSVGGSYDQNWYVGGGNSNLFNFTVPAGENDSEVKGPIVITYTTTVMDTDDAHAANIWGSQNINNTVSAGGKSSSGGGTKDYGEEPRFPVEKIAKDSDDQEITSALQPGDIINYTVTYGGEGWSLDGAYLLDQMSDIQKLSGSVTVALDKPLLRTITWPDGTVWEAGRTSFTMPAGSSQWAEDGVVWTDFFDDGQYSLSNDWPRVYALRLPDGRGETNPYFTEGTVMTVTYSTSIITEAEALASSITGLQNAYNRTTANNQSSQTQVPVQFPNEVTHKPTIEKEPAGLDLERNLVYWTIHVTADTANGSSYPLKYVDVYENVANHNAKWENSMQGVYNQFVDAEDFVLVEAVVTTDSGVVLQPGEDYTIDKTGANDNPAHAEGQAQQTFYMAKKGNPSFSFPELTEGVTIRLAYGIKDNNIINGFHAYNTATVSSLKDKYQYYEDSDDAEQRYETTDIDVTKNGKLEDGRYVKWVVRINPSKQEYQPDTASVMFDDVLPEGHILVNYADKTDHEHPSIYVDYGWDGGYYLSGFHRAYSIPAGTTHIHQELGGDVYNENGTLRAAGVGLHKQSFVVTYYTYVTDAEWDRITSSLTGSETYSNTAIIDVDGDHDFGATGDVTVTSNGFIWKQDTTQENSEGIVIDSSNRTTNVLSYQIDVNPYGMQLVSEENATLTLTDRISTNMDLDTSRDGIIIEYESAPGIFVNIKDVDSSNENYEAFQAIKVSYNDDTRYVTVVNIPDKIHFKITYNTVVRAQGTDTFENTAVLTGGGSHSASTHESHTIQKSGGNIAGGTANISLRKIDENDISVKIVGATFEFYECTLSNADEWKYPAQDSVIGEGTVTWTDKEHFNFNRIENAVPNIYEGTTGNDETSQLEADFAIVSERLIGEATSNSNGVVQVPGTLKEETLYYWVETASPEGYTAELNVKHYFVVYQVYGEDDELLGLETQEVGRDGTTKLKEWETRQWRAWALDDAAQYANGITVASLAADNTWTVNNQKAEYTSISATKEWEGDYDNFYETRPSEGIQLKLIQVSSDGTEEQYGPIIPINVAKDKNGNILLDESGKEVWPTYIWQQLPKTGNNDDGDVVTYTYRVEELPISGYTTTYTAGGSAMPSNGVETGEITVTNTLIPTKTNISVKKVFEQDGTTYPDQILVYLYEITTNKETGVQTRAQRSSYALTAAGGWEYTWKNLPTKDEDGNTLTYTVVEGAVGDGFSYTVSYSDNGEGITGNTADDPLVITNTENGLEITKTFGGDAARLMEDNETAAAMRALISFTVTDGTNQVSFNVEDMTANDDGTYSFKMTSTTYPWLTPGKTVYVQETNEAFTNTDLVSVSYSINGGETVTVTDNMETVTVNGYTVSGGLDTIDFTNEYYEDTVNLSVDKTWLNVEGQTEDWPEGMTVTFNLTADEGDGAIATGDTKIMTGAGQMVTFTDLPKYVLNTNTEIVYSVTETVDGYESSITSRQVDEDGNVALTVTNKKASPRLYVQKVWEGSTDFIPSSLTVDLYESETAGATTGGTFKHTITLTAADSWKGFFETDSEGNKLVEGKYYYIQERGAGGWTLSSYSAENGQAFVDLETITVTNTRSTTPPPPGKTSVSVQKKWTVNGQPADPEDWDAVDVQLVRYKAEAPVSTCNVHVYNWVVNGDNQAGYLHHMKDFTLVQGETASLKTDSTYWLTYFTFTSMPSGYTNQWQLQNGTSPGWNSDGCIYTFTVPNSSESWLVVTMNSNNDINGWGKVDITDITQRDESAESSDGGDIAYSAGVVVETITLGVENAWQYEFSNLDTESSDGAYIYAYTVVETDISKQTSRITTGGTEITLEDDSAVETGGNVVITNNKEYGSITVNKSVLKNNAADEEAVGQTITVGLFSTEQTNGSETTPTDAKTITIGSDSTGSVTFDKLTLGQTYYVYEIVDNKVVTNDNTATINNIAYTAGQVTESASLNAENKTATIDITNSRTEEENGSLTITKNVTVNGHDTTTNLADRAYVFSIAGPSPATTVVKYVQITVTNGKAASYKVADGPTEPVDWSTVEAAGNFAADAETREAVVSGLAAGDYTITEIEVTGMTTKVSGGKNSVTNASMNSITVTVTAGETVEATAKATFTNDKTPMTSFNFNKIWLGPTGNVATPTSYQDWQDDITVTIKRKAGASGAEDNNFVLKYTISKSEDTFTATMDTSASKLPEVEGTLNALTLTGSSTSNVFNFTLPVESLRKYNDDGTEWVYYVVESEVPLYVTSYGTATTGDSGTSYSVTPGAQDAKDGGVIVNQTFGGYELPSTGGPGTRLFTILGSILILGAGVLMWRKRRTI